MSGPRTLVKVHGSSCPRPPGYEYIYPRDPVLLKQLEHAGRDVGEPVFAHYTTESFRTRLGTCASTKVIWTAMRAMSFSYAVLEAFPGMEKEYRASLVSKIRMELAAAYPNDLNHETRMEELVTDFIRATTKIEQKILETGQMIEWSTAGGEPFEDYLEKRLQRYKGQATTPVAGESSAQGSLSNSAQSLNNNEQIIDNDVQMVSSDTQIIGTNIQSTEGGEADENGQGNEDVQKDLAFLDDIGEDDGSWQDLLTRPGSKN